MSLSVFLEVVEIRTKVASVFPLHYGCVVLVGVFS